MWNANILLGIQSLNTGIVCTLEPCVTLVCALNIRSPNLVGQGETSLQDCANGSSDMVTKTMPELWLCFLEPVWPGMSKNSIKGFRQRYWKQNGHNWDEIWGWFCILDAWISLGLFIYPWKHIITTKQQQKKSQTLLHRSWVSLSSATEVSFSF